MKTRIKYLSVLLVIAISWSPAFSYSFAAPQYAQAAPAFSDNELDEMLAPIALYPDPLLAQVLPAASFGDQIDYAQQLLRGHVDEGLIEAQNWDMSVKAIAHYPDILHMMAENPEWTAALGQAYVTQEQGVSRSIQYLRQQALNSGALQSSSQMHVVVEHGFIRIVPAQARVIYVPQYNPYAVWGFPSIINTPAPASGLIGFGTSMLIGSWLNRDWDWSGRGPYYHGWQGSGWVGASRQYVNTTHNYYINNRFTNINVNNNVNNRNTRDFRERVHRDAISRTKPGPRPEAPARPAPPAQPPREKPAPPAHTPPEVGKTPSAPKPPTPEAKPAPQPPSEVQKTPPTPAPEAKPAPTPEAKPAPAPQRPPRVRQAPPTPNTAPPPRAKPAPAPQRPPQVRQAPPTPNAAPAPRAKPAPAPQRPPQARQAPPTPNAAPAPRAKPAPAPAPQAKPAPAPKAPSAKPAPPEQNPPQGEQK